MTFGDALLYSLTGMLVVFFALVLLMFVLQIMGRIMHRETPAAQPAKETPAAPAPEAPKAPGSAGELKLYDTDPRDAAMIMAIVADSLGKPLNELRFISIREVREDEV